MSERKKTKDRKKSNASSSATAAAAPAGLISPPARRLMKRVLYRDPVLFTATELSAALSVPRWKFFSYDPKSRAAVVRTYGKVLGFAEFDLPQQLQEILRLARGAKSCDGLTETLVRLKLQERRRHHVLSITTQRLAPGPDAFRRRAILDVYFCVIDNGQPASHAFWEARKKHFEIFEAGISERQLRRIINRVDAFGGPELAPIDAYSFQKSVPHPKAQKTT